MISSMEPRVLALNERTQGDTLDALAQGLRRLEHEFFDARPGSWADCLPPCPDTAPGKEKTGDDWAYEGDNPFHTDPRTGKYWECYRYYGDVSPPCPEGIIQHGQQCCYKPPEKPGDDSLLVTPEDGNPGTPHLIGFTTDEDEKGRAKRDWLLFLLHGLIDGLPDALTRLLSLLAGGTGQTTEGYHKYWPPRGAETSPPSRPLQPGETPPPGWRPQPRTVYGNG